MFTTFGSNHLFGCACCGAHAGPFQAMAASGAGPPATNLEANEGARRGTPRTRRSGPVRRRDCRQSPFALTR